MEKQLGWAYKQDGAESLGISEVGQTVLARLIESQIWYQLAGSVGETNLLIFLQGHQDPARFND